MFSQEISCPLTSKPMLLQPDYTSVGSTVERNIGKKE
jgi:hypothetical protein